MFELSLLTVLLFTASNTCPWFFGTIQISTCFYLNLLRGFGLQWSLFSCDLQGYAMLVLHCLFPKKNCENFSFDCICYLRTFVNGRSHRFYNQAIIEVAFGGSSSQIVSVNFTLLAFKKYLF